MRKKKKKSTSANVQHSSESVEHFTPVDIVSRARLVLDGPIDLDPASCEEANQVIQARRFFTEEDDGLTQPWKARRVFVNPPGGIIKEPGRRQESRARLWWEKSIEEWQAGRARCVIFLAFSIELFKSSQMNSIAGYMFPFVVPRVRIPFDYWDAEAGERKAGQQPTHSNAVILLPDPREPGGINRFAKYFEDVGQVRI